MKKYNQEVISKGNSLILRIKPKRWYLCWLICKAFMKEIRKIEQKNTSRSEKLRSV